MTILEALDPYIDKINELEKENAELKKENNYLTQVNKELNEKLKEDVESLASINIKAQNIIAELKAHIKKMKFDIKIEAERNAYISQATLNHLLEQWEKAE